MRRAPFPPLGAWGKNVGFPRVSPRPGLDGRGRPSPGRGLPRGAGARRRVGSGRVGSGAQHWRVRGAGDRAPRAGRLASGPPSELSAPRTLRPLTEAHLMSFKLMG